MSILQAKVESVKGALSSTSTGKPATASISNILASKPVPTGSQDAASSRGIRQIRPMTQTKPGRTTRSVVKKTFATTQRTENQRTEELPAKEKATLAAASKLVASKLRTNSCGTNIEELLMAVLQGLESPITVDGNELNELLTEVSRARRAAIIWVSNLKAIEDASGAKNEGVRQLCESLILQCPRFLLRYLGKSPSNESTTKVILGFEQRRHNVARSVPNTVDSALYLAKSLRTQGRLTWEIIDSLLQDCLALLEATEISMPDSNNTSDAVRTSYFTRISNLYYSQHLNMRRDAPNPSDIQHLRPLRRSIDSVRSRSTTEKKEAALTAKLGRMADLLRDAGRLDEAKDIILCLRDELIGDGTLALVASAALTLPIRAAWNQTGDTLLLARTFSLLLRLKNGTLNTLHDLSLNMNQWSPDEKGAVLEHILDILSRHSEGSAELQKTVYKELISTYDPRTFPVRRLRVICNFTQTNPDQRCDIVEEAQSTSTLASVESVVANSSDSALSLYVTHIRSLLSSTLELQEDHPRVNFIEPHLATWCSIIDKCKDQETLYQNIDNVDSLHGHLRSVADFLDMKGFGKTRVAVLRMIANIDEIARRSNPDDIVLDYCFLATQYLDLGYSGKAGLALDKAQSSASSRGVTTNTLIRRLVAYADYLLQVGNLDKCEETLSCAHSAAEQQSEANNSHSSTSYSERDGSDRIMADASIVYSDLALRRGKPQEALIHAKRSLRIMARAWKRAERYQLSRIKIPQSPDDTTTEKLVEVTSNMNVTTATGLSQVHNIEVGPSAWMLARPMFRCLVHLSQVYAHHGMFQDTIYYAEQAHKVAINIDSTNYIAEALALIGDAWLKAGNIEKASGFLTQAKNMASVQKEAHTSVVLSGSLGTLHSMQGDNNAELAAYTDAERTLNSLTSPTYINDLDQVFDVTAILQAKISRLAIGDPKKNRRPQRKRVVKVPAKKNEPTSKQSVDILISASDQCVRLVSLRGSILRQKARSFARCDRFEDSSSTIEEAVECSLSALDAIETHVTQAECLFRQSSALLPGDSVYSVLQDSTISFPAVVGAKTALSSDRISTFRSTPPRNNHSGLQRNTSLPHGSSITWVDPLKQAHDHLLEAYSTASQISSTRVLNQIASFLNTTSLLLSTYHGHKPKTFNPGAIASALELAKATTVQRERGAVLSDAAVSTGKEDDLRWPVISNYGQKENSERIGMQQSRFQKEYIDIIPSTWRVISIMLSESRDELVLAKFEAGHSPFTLRVPLERNNSRDADEEVFGFDHGKTELHEIINLANSSAHGGRDVSGREGKIAWWAERDDLNIRLKELLDNIEKVWLGGFKGIFSQHEKHPDLLARFQKSFHNTLDKYLPSRQRTIRRGKTSPRVALDPRTLELFVGLGDPFSEENDLDEPLTDLLYFVVDILQFHGERNAYDEIDFDSMVLDTLDALRCYHQAAPRANITTNRSHTVLILDKSLHSFPWESLPCMDGQAVSRLPSIGCLRDRILRQKNTTAERLPSGIYINRRKGGYVLNPGRDLKTTQATFESELKKLEDWNSVVEREPVEAELKDILAKEDLYLYFGHGSGAQYIRSKTIKKLDKCATTFLMGCSSATLVDVGEFIPYGPPMNYMMAGAPAVVGSLWDVTDKDIDRFAKSTFESWGLYENSVSEAVEKAPKTPGRGTRKVEEPVVVKEKEKVSLVAAVAEGKKACNFKYLTAAAVVVYGVPVYFA